MLKFISQIEPSRAGIASIFAAVTGQFSTLANTENLDLTNTAMQHAAWLVAILAGVVSIVNGCRRWFRKNNRPS